MTQLLFFRLMFGGMFLLGVLMLGVFLVQCWVFRDDGFPSGRLPKFLTFEEWCAKKDEEERKRLDTNEN